MTVIPKYSYKLRPGYESSELLLEFNCGKSADDLQNDLFTILKNANYQLTGSGDLWMNDEVLFFFNSKKGTVILSRDIWDFFFIMGEKNQTDILKIDHVLSENELFLKQEVDFSEYQKPRV